MLVNLRRKRSLAEHLLEWASEREGPLVKFAKKRPILGKLFERRGLKVMNRDECLGSFREDLRMAKKEVLVYSPFLNDVDVARFLAMRELRDVIGRGVKVRVVTRPPKDLKSLEKLSKAGVEVYLRDGFHEKVLVVDENITYIGSANILAWPSSSDVMQRVEGSDVATEILAKIALPKEGEKFPS